MLPKMRKKEIEFIKKTLLDVSDSKHSMNVLEWGSGGSTVFFTDFLRKHNVNYTWISLEYNTEWFNKVNDAIKKDKSVNLILFDVGNGNLKQTNISMDDYVYYPLTLNIRFDVIIIDGRKRRRCLEVARKIWTEGGVVLLHDAHRKYYQCAFEFYKNARLVQPYLWMATNKTPSMYKKISNYFVIVSYSMIRMIDRYVKSFARRFTRFFDTYIIIF